MRFPTFAFVVATCLAALASISQAGPVRVLVWDEQQPQQRMAYSNFLGLEIAAYLKAQPGLEVRTASISDPAQGVGATALDQTDVLIWWGHVRNREVPSETGKAIVQRIQAGQLSLIALHSAHWSTPFVEAMRERARQDARAALPEADRAHAVLIETNRYANFYTPPRSEDLRTPCAWYRKPFDGPVEITLALPNCCFPAYRPDAMPSQMRVLNPGHPIVQGVPLMFTIPRTEMYNEPFHVPPPDEVVLEERWASGEWFRSGSVWQLGRGRVFYFRPGHELYPVYKEASCLKILENAARWLAAQQTQAASK